MKKRNGFVSNSSSSSFLLIESNLNTTLVDAGSGDSYEYEQYTCSIDDMIKMLQTEKDNGAYFINFKFGGGMD